MPAIITHYLFAQAVLPPQARGEKCEPVYTWGSQGPDFLFFSPLLNPLRSRTLVRIGSEMHDRDAARNLSFMADCLRGRQGAAHEALLAYLLGYLSHYILDSTFHPYVYGMQRYYKRMLPEAGENYIHRQIETTLDVLFLQRMRQQTIRDFSVASHFVRTPELNAACEMYRTLFAARYGAHFSVPSISRAFLSLKVLYTLFYSPRGFKKRAVTFAKRLTGSGHPALMALIHPVEPAHEIDFANEKRAIHEAGNEALTHTAYELMDIACARYRAALPTALELFANGGDFSVVTHGINFEGAPEQNGEKS